MSWEEFFADAPMNASFLFHPLYRTPIYMKKAGHEITACFLCWWLYYTNSIMTISAASPRRGPSL